MKKFCLLFMIALSLFIFSGIPPAQAFDAFLTAGPSTLYTGLDANRAMDQGYMRIGFSGLYTNEDKGGYKIFEGHVAVGNDILIEGLSGELGIKGLIGSTDTGHGTSSLGGLAFMAGGAYTLSKIIFPVSTKIFAEVSWAPDPLAFMDMKRYFDTKLGVDVYIVEKAALEFVYQHYGAEIKGIQRHWTKENNLVTVGIKLKF